MRPRFDCPERYRYLIVRVRRIQIFPPQVFHGTLVDATCTERPACPITEVTRAYALQLADGRLLDLGEAGTTFVGAALNGCKDTRPLINRIVYSIWPKATVKGRLHGSKIMVDSVSID